MINVLNLFWIIPVSALVGMLLGAFFIGTTQLNREYDAYEEGYIHGLLSSNTSSEVLIPKTFGEFFNGTCNSDFNKFNEITDSVFYGVNEDDQMYIILIEDEYDINKYLNNEVISINYVDGYQRPVIKG